MLDTITLRLKEKDFHIIDHSVFSPDSTNLFEPPYARLGSKGYIEAHNSPTNKDFERGIYKPSLKVRKRWVKDRFEIYLYITFSAPKLIFSNNFDELEDEDYENIVYRLKDQMLLMSVVVNEKSIIDAEIVKVHFSKNIVLKNFVIPYMIMQDLSKVDLSLYYDISEKDYRNGGNSLRYHSNEFELIFYDKVKDLLQAKTSEKRSIEKENNIQLHLLDKFELIKPFEVFRIEARYNSKRKLQREFPEITTLRQCVNSETSSKILSTIWSKVLNSYKALTVIRDEKQHFIQSVMALNPRCRLSTILSAYTYLDIANSIGIRDLRRLIEKNYSRKTWYSLRDKINSLEFNTSTPDYLTYISDKLKKYEATKLNLYNNAFKNQEK